MRSSAVGYLRCNAAYQGWLAGIKCGKKPCRCLITPSYRVYPTSQLGNVPKQLRPTDVGSGRRLGTRAHFPDTPCTVPVSLSRACSLICAGAGRSGRQDRAGYVTQSRLSRKDRHMAPIGRSFPTTIITRMPSVLLAASITQPRCGTEIGAGQFREHCRPKAHARYSSGLLHPDGALPGESTIYRDKLPPWSREAGSAGGRSRDTSRPGRRLIPVGGLHGQS